MPPSHGAADGTRGGIGLVASEGGFRDPHKEPACWNITGVVNAVDGPALGNTAVAAAAAVAAVPAAAGAAAAAAARAVGAAIHDRIDAGNAGDAAKA